MSDVIDNLIDKISPRVINLVDKFEPEDETPRYYSHKLENTLKELESIRAKRYIRDVKTKTSLLEDKTSKCKVTLVKYKKELERIEELMKDPQNIEKNEVYARKIKDLQTQLFSLMKDVNSTNPIDLFDDVTKLHNEIKDVERKCKTLEEKIKVYEGLPDNLHDAKNSIAEIKERIKDKELFLEKSIFMNL